MIDKKNFLLEERIFTVSEFLDFLNNILQPIKVIVVGEIGDKIADYRTRNGFLYFNLLDKGGSLLKCSVFSSVIDNLGIELEPGLEVKVVGYTEIRKKWGELKFQVERIELVGEGVLKKQFEFLKKKLKSLGYFNQENKKLIPKFCENIGLITSKYGRGAMKDFLTHLDNFGFNIYFYDTRVEGSFAIDDLVEAIEFFNKNFTNLDVIVLIRGGGDWESLKPFNSEELAKAIFSSRIPIITGIGHEDDETLADMVADLRASTPTHAAKILSDHWKLANREINYFIKNFSIYLSEAIKIKKEYLMGFKKEIASKIEKVIKDKNSALLNLSKNLNLKFEKYFQEFYIIKKEFFRKIAKIALLMKEKEKELKNISVFLNKNLNYWLQRLNYKLKQHNEKLHLANPLLKLKQGYTITFDEQNKIIKGVEQLKIVQKIKTKFYQGEILSEIKKIKSKNVRRKI